MIRPLVFAILCAVLSTNIAAHAEEKKNTLSLDAQRSAALKELEVTNVPDLQKIRDLSVSIFSQPIESQKKEQLIKLAKESNRATNLISSIYDEYASYYRENYRYEFIQEKVQPAYIEYETVRNEFIKIRNIAYYNLGLISKSSGNTIEAFLYFKDALRLRSFDCGPSNPAKDCMRWKAEQELQSLLGLTKIKAYVSWK